MQGNQKITQGVGKIKFKGQTEIPSKKKAKQEKELNKNVREAKRIKNFKKEGDVKNTVSIKKYPMALAFGDPGEELRLVTTEVKLHLVEVLSKHQAGKG